MLRKLIEWYKRNIIIAIFTVLIIEAIIAYLFWSLGGSRQTFGPLSSYGLIWLSIAIASIAAITSVFSSISTRDSLAVTRQSLELTRATTRPFLTFRKVDFFMSLPESEPRLQILICNLGSLPATEILVRIGFEYITNDGQSIRTDSDVIMALRKILGSNGHPEVKIASLFPKEETFATFFIPSTLPETIAKNKQTLIDIQIEYRFAQIQFKTFRTLLLNTQKKRGQQQIRHEFVSDKEYWD